MRLAALGAGFLVTVAAGYTAGFAAVIQCIGSEEVGVAAGSPRGQVCDTPLGPVPYLVVVGVVAYVAAVIGALRRETTPWRAFVLSAALPAVSMLACVLALSALSTR